MTMPRLKKKKKNKIYMLEMRFRHFDIRPILNSKLKKK